MPQDDSDSCSSVYSSTALIIGFPFLFRNNPGLEPEEISDNFESPVITVLKESSDFFRFSIEVAGFI